MKEKDVYGLSQSELVARAFASPEDIEEEFRKEKQAEIDRENERKKKEKGGADEKVAGWGSWAGKGVPPPRKRSSGSGKLGAPSKKNQKKGNVETNPLKRRDANNASVIINEKRIKKLSGMKLSAVPYPFTSAEQYEMSIRAPVGAEWQTSKAVKDSTRPEVITRAGKIIAPIHSNMKTNQKKKTAVKALAGARRAKF